MKKTVLGLVFVIIFGTVITACGSDKIQLFNVSYDPTRELYLEFNQSFVEYWEEQTGEEIEILMSHGGSGAQARTVIDGADADVTTLALAYDIDAVADAGLLEEDWQSRLEDNSSPYLSTIVFLTRSGNPLNIQDWDDLVRDDVQVITPNPKTSGGARWNYLAAWGYAQVAFDNDEEQIKEFLREMFENVPVLDTGARGSTITFVQREIGDVFLSWENEAYLALDEYGEDAFEIIYPSVSILAEPPVAIVDSVVDRKGTREIAEAYLNHLYTEEGQRMAARHYYRPRHEAVAEEFRDQFPELELLTIDDDFGGWLNAQTTHFSDGGTFDEIYE